MAEVNGEIIPFEVKYRSQHAGISELKGLIDLCDQKPVARGYVITKAGTDFGFMAAMSRASQNGKAVVDIMRIPATLLCYWLGAIEVSGL